MERSAIAGWQSQHINKRTLHYSACSSRLGTSARQSPDDVASHIDSTCNAMTRIGLTIAQTSLFECAVGQFCSQEIDLRHAAEHRSTDQSRNGCRMCYFCHAQLFEITRVANIKNTLVQHPCRNAEVVEAFCRVAASRSIPVDQFTSRLLLHFTHLPRCRQAAPPLDPHSARCLAGAQLPATSCLGAFRTPAATARG